MNMSAYLAKALLEAVFRNQPYTSPETVYLALYTSNPTENDTGQEVTGGAYTRKPITFTDPATENGKQTIKNATDIEFDVATSDWGTVTHVGIRDAEIGGNLLYFGELESPRTILEGDRFVILAENAILRLS